MPSKNNICLLAYFSLLVLTVVLSSCGGPSGDGEAQALAESIALTATARAVGDISPADALKTARAEATTQSQSMIATQAAQAALSAEEQAATATAFAPFIAELPIYGVDPARGRPGWIHPPVTLDIDGYQQNAAKNRFILTIAQDFVISADITWNTQYGTSGCGFAIRSDGDEEKPSQYMAIATRCGLGHVLFAIMDEGEMVSQWDIYAKGHDEEFDWQNDSTNSLTVVGRGTIFHIYTNGSLIGEVDVENPPSQPSMPPMPEEPLDTSDADAMAKYKDELDEYEEEVEQLKAQFQAGMGGSEEHETIFERGFVTMLAISESGHTVCRFDNAWLWLIEE